MTADDYEWTPYVSMTEPQHADEEAAQYMEREIEELVGVAMRMKTVRDKWRYFCGCCHTRIKQNVEMAARIIAQEEAVNGP